MIDRIKQLSQRHPVNLVNPVGIFVTPEVSDLRIRESYGPCGCFFLSSAVFKSSSAIGITST